MTASQRSSPCLLISGGVATSTINVSPDTGAGTFPLRTASGRFFTGANAQPFFMVADSPQGLVVNLAPTDRVTGTDTGTYLAARKAQGFNTIWTNILCVEYTGGRADGSTFDGILPFTGTIPGGQYDLTTPNETYFARADAIIRLAAAYGFCVMIDPIETGGWRGVALNNGTTRCRTYGRFLSSRYKGFPNVTWLHGNDYAQADWSAYDPVLTQVAAGIRDNMPSALQSVEVEQNFSVADLDSLASSTWAPLIDFNSVYLFTDQVIYPVMLQGYNRTGHLPTVMVEASYENQTVTTVLPIRRQIWWTIVTGGSGYFYGADKAWDFEAGWQFCLGAPTSPGADQIRHAVALLNGRAWQGLVPDQAHTFLTAGAGTSGNVNFAIAAKAADGTLGIVYVPFSSNVTVNLALMAGPVTARWFDPANGTFTSAGSGLTSSHTFTHPGNNSFGDADWVLLLES